jgi:thioredoxin-like negative regulator of GroEL
MATGSNLYEVQSPDQFKDLLSKDLQRVSLLYFWAPWAEPCKQMTEVVTELSKKYPKLLSLKIEAEKQDEILESFDIESVPTFIILRVRHIFEFLSPELDTQIHLSIANVGSYFAGPHNRRRCVRPLHCH